MPSIHTSTTLNAEPADLAQPPQDVAAEIPGSRTRCHGFLKGRGCAQLHYVSEVMRDTYRRNAGLLLVVASQIFLSLMNLSAKKLNSIDPPVSVLEIILVRMAITYICSITYISGYQPECLIPSRAVRLLLAFRGFAGFFGLFGIYFSLQFLSLSDATVLTFLAPLCTSVTGAVFLGERFTRREAFAALLSLVGVILIARPPFIFGPSNNQAPDVLHQGNEVTPEERLIAVGVALVGVLGATGAYTSLRAIGKRAHPLHSLVSYSTQCVIVASIGILVTKTPFIVPTRLDWFAMLVMIGIFGFIAQVLLTMAFARETAGRCSMGMYTQIVFATILEQIFFHTVPAVLSIIGTLIIVSCALYIALNKESSSSTGKIKLEGNEENILECGLARHDSEDNECQMGSGGGDQERWDKVDRRDQLKASNGSLIDDT